MSTAPERYDLAVVGSGPAGSSAALAAAERGFRTVILEKADLPRYKTCGGGLVLRARKLIPVDLRSAIERECYKAELYLQDVGLHFLTERSEPMVSMTMREDFDFQLLNAARNAGAALETGCEVTDVSPRGETIGIHTTRGLFRARFVVAADGAMSRTARKAGWSETRVLNPALECEIPVNENHLERFSSAARFDFGVVGGGYGWVFPKRRHLSVGVMSTREPGSPSLHNVLERYLSTLGIQPTETLKPHGFVIPVSPRKGTFVKSRVILAGDAAGLADPLTGEGITFAIMSGQLAARAIAQGNFLEERVRRLYHESLEEHVLPELRLSLILSDILYRRPRMRNWLFKRYGQTFCEAVTDVLTGDSTYRRKLSNPKNYVKLLASTFL